MMTFVPSFSEPWVLVLLAIVPALVWWWRRRGHGSMGFSSIDLLVGLPAGRSKWARHGGWLLRFLGLAAIIVALAGPRWPAPSPYTTEGIALAMVVDASASMDNSDFLSEEGKISRLEGVKKIFRLFLEGGQTPDGTVLTGRPQDLVMFVKYARYPTTLCPLTLDHAVLFKKLKELRVASPDEGAESNPGDAVGWALNSLKKATTVKRKVIILLTDGEFNVKTPAWQPIPAASVAKSLSIPIYVIDANPESNTGEEAEKARKSLQEVAQISDGRYFKASDAKALAEVYAQIDQQEKSRLATFEYRKYYDGFLWFALAGLTCWLNLVFLEATLWRKVP